MNPPPIIDLLRDIGTSCRTFIAISVRKRHSSHSLNPNTLILFDHNADGIKMVTGWIKADDGIVVLKTLAELNIASIGVVGTEIDINLGNGITMPLAATFTRTDGSTGTNGTPHGSGSLLLKTLPWQLQRQKQAKVISGLMPDLAKHPIPGKLHEYRKEE